jgi:hypothetical protein
MKAHVEQVALVLSPARAAETIGVPERTLEAWRWRRVGPPFVKLGKRVGYRPDDLHAWLAAQTVATDGGRRS